jgi:hypothetical protein
MWKENLNTGRPLHSKKVFCMYAESKIAGPPSHLLNRSPPIFIETIMMEQAVEAVEGTDSINSIKHAL